LDLSLKSIEVTLYLCGEGASDLLMRPPNLRPKPIDVALGDFVVGIS